jgi:hypothetical protein
VKNPTKADLAAAVARLTQENAGLRDLLAAISLAAGTVPVSKDNDYPAEWKRSTKVLAVIKNAADLSDWDGYLAWAAEETRSLAAEPVGYEVYQPEGPGVTEPAQDEPEPVACGSRPYPAGSEGDDGTECALPAGHGGAHDDNPPFGGAWCPAFTDMEDFGATIYCDRPAGHPGSHHASGPDEGSEVAWSDEPDICESAYLAPGIDYYCSLDAGHAGLHSQHTSAGAFIAEWGYPDGHVHTTSGHEPVAVAS